LAGQGTKPRPALSNRDAVTQIGRFYNGRHHTSILHSVRKIEELRKTDESIDALVEVLTAELWSDLHEYVPTRVFSSRSVLVDVVASRVIEQLNETGRRLSVLQPEKAMSSGLLGAWNKNRLGLRKPPRITVDGPVRVSHPVV
jgi:hypothetical protein